MFLDDDDVRNLTGFQRPSAQVRWLRDRAYPFELAAGGKPKILRSVVEDRLGGRIESEPRVRLA